MHKKFLYIFFTGVITIIFLGVIAISGKTETKNVPMNFLKDSVLATPEELASVANLGKSSSLEDKFRTASYNFSLQPQYPQFQDKVIYQPEKEVETKERLQHVANYLETLTKHGTDFSEAKSLRNMGDWKTFVEDIARLKYDNFGKSEILNDLNNAGALILQAEVYDDQPSFQYLYKLISDLNAGIHDEQPSYGLSRTYGTEITDQTIYNHLLSKLKKAN